MNFNETIINHINKFKNIKYKDRSIYDKSSKFIEILNDNKIDKEEDFIIDYIMSITKKNKLLNKISINSDFLLDLLKLTKNNIFTDKIVTELYKILENQVVSFDGESQLKVIQICASELKSNIYYINKLKSMFSIVMNLFCSTDSTVSIASFASFQQMLTVLIDFVRTNKYNDLDHKYKDSLSCLVNSDFHKRFSDPLETIPFLFINDICNYILNKQMLWLNVNITNFKSEMIDLFENIFVLYSDFIKEVHPLLHLIESTIVNQKPDISNIELFIKFSIYYYNDSKVVGSLINFFINLMNNDKYQYSLIYFRGIFIANKEIIEYFKNNYYMYFNQLFVRINNIINSYDIIVDLSPYEQKEYNDLVFAIDISIIVIQHLKEDSFFSEIWRHLVTSIVFIIRLCGKVGIESLFQLYQEIILHCEEARFIMIKILCSLVSGSKIISDDLDTIEEIANGELHMNKKVYFIRLKRTLGYHLLVDLLHLNANLFSNYFSELFHAFSFFPEIELDIAFTNNLNDSDLLNIINLLTKKSKYYLKISVNIISEVRNRNISFLQIIINNIPKLITSNIEFQEECINIIKTSVACVSFVDNEELIFELIYKCCNENLSINSQNSIIELASDLIKYNVNNIENGWSYIIKIISTQKGVINNENIISAYNILQVLSSNCFECQNKTNKINIITLIFDYAKQSMNLNISLSSLNFLWDINSFIGSDTDLWKAIFKELFELLNDKRIDLSTSSVSTIFSLASTNAAIIPYDCFVYMINSCLIPKLNKFNFFPSDWNRVQLFLLSLVSFLAKFWNVFCNIEEFESNLLPLLIQKQYDLLLHCESQEIASSSCSFYEELFKSSNISSNIRNLALKSFSNSILRLTRTENSNSLVLFSLVKQVYVALSYKDLIRDSEVQIWGNIVYNVSLILPSDKVLNYSTKKCLSAFLNHLPSTQEKTEMILHYTVQIADKTNFPLLIDFIIKSIIDIINILQDNYLYILINKCVQISHLEPASGLIELFPGLNSRISKSNLLLYMISLLSYYDLPIVKKKIQDVLVHNFKLLDIMEIHSFIYMCNGKTDLIISLLNKYYNTDSKHYDNSIFENTFDQLISVISKMIECNNEKIIQIIYKFRVKKKSYGTNCDCDYWHFYKILDSLLYVANSDNKQIREIANSIITLVSKDINLLQK